MSSLSSKVKVSRRFQKAVRVDSDYGDARALEGYVCSPSAVQILRHMAAQVSETGQGAFTWTGPYGGGKSSLALLLGFLLNGDESAGATARTIVGARTADAIVSKIGGGRIVIPVVGRRADPEAAILEAAEAVGVKGRRRPSDALGALAALSDRSAGGVLLIIDEMGKFLEHAAHSGDGDVYFFQQLAEEASRSKGRLLVVGILHQAFDDYAHRLAREVRDEWLKIQGRFSDIPLNIAADEQVELISRAIEVKGRPRPAFPRAEKLAAAMRRANADVAAIAERLAHCWPLDPAVAMLLGPLSRRRFGQSQRSIFGFLNSAEPFGFQSFLTSAPEDGSQTYDLPRLWDYLRANLEPSILASPDGHRWALAVDALERCESRGGDAEHVDVVKSVALIDLFKERSGLAASHDVLRACLPGVPAARLDEVLGHLAAWSVVIHKKHLGAFAIYAGSDFDIEAAVLEARAKMTGIDFARLKTVAALQPILAKRFYHKTGALIWFDVGRGLAAMVDQGLAALRGAYQALLGDLEDVMLRELRVRGPTPEALADIKDRAAVVRGLTGNYRLDAFATRLTTYDFAAANREAIEGIASLAVGKPARDWVDRDIGQARIEIAALAQEFVKAEGFAHVKGRADRRVNVAIYTSDWRKDAPVRAEVDVATTEDRRVEALVQRMQAIFDAEGVGSDVALAVMADRLPIRDGVAPGSDRPWAYHFRRKGRSVPQTLPHSHISNGGRFLRGEGASPAVRSWMNARGSGVVSGERRDLTKSVEGFSKPGEGKSRSSGRKFKKRGSEIQVSFFRKSSLFKRARGQIQIARLREGMAKDCNASAPKRVHAPPLSNLQGAWKEFKIRGKEIKTSRNKFKVRRNEIQIQQN